MNLLRTLRTISLIFLAGSATGAYGEWNYLHKESERTLSVALRGYCAQRDVTGQPYWYSCQDALIAAELTQRDIARDQETAAIMVEMNKPSKKR